MTNPPLGLNFVARVTVQIGELIEVGSVPDGVRRVIPIISGVVSGPGITGTVPALGADWNMVRADGSETVSARYIINTDDGVVISVLNEGVIDDGPFGRFGLTRLSLEAPLDTRYAFLNDAVLVGGLGVESTTDGDVTVVLEYWRADFVDTDART